MRLLGTHLRSLGFRGVVSIVATEGRWGCETVMRGAWFCIRYFLNCTLNWCDAVSAPGLVRRIQQLNARIADIENSMSKSIQVLEDKLSHAHDVVGELLSIVQFVHVVASFPRPHCAILQD